MDMSGPVAVGGTAGRTYRVHKYIFILISYRGNNIMFMLLLIKNYPSPKKNSTHSTSLSINVQLYMLKWKIFFFPVHQSRYCNLMPINGFAELSFFVFITRTNGGLSYYILRVNAISELRIPIVYLLWRSRKGYCKSCNL